MSVGEVNTKEGILIIQDGIFCSVSKDGIKDDEGGSSIVQPLQFCLSVGVGPVQQ